MKSFDLLSNFFQFYVKKSKEKYHKNMSDYVEVENLPKANELINDDYVLINQNEDDAKVDMGTIKEFVRPPNASTTESGLVTTTAQSFSGKKSFTETSANKSTIDNLISNKATLGDATVNDLHITGNLIQDGEVIETEVETLKVKDQVIVTRSGATTGMTDGEVTGIVAEKYDGQNNGVLVFGSDGIARVGDEGDAQPLATREESPNNGSIQIWDEQTQSLKSFPFGQKGQYLRQGENGLEFGTAAAADGTASEEYVNQKVQEEATLRQNAIEDAKNLANATGVLAVAKGGTGATTANNACNGLIGALSVGQDIPKGEDFYISQYAGGSELPDTDEHKKKYYRRPVSALWKYMEGKISSVLGLTASLYKGKATTAIEADSSSKSHRIVESNAKTTTGLRFFQRSNDESIMPELGWCSLIRCQHREDDYGYYQDLAFTFDKDEIKYRRCYNKSIKDWKTIAFTDSTVANATNADTAKACTGNSATATKATQDGSGNNIVDTYATKSIATTSANGLMSSADKSKLDGIERYANKYTLPIATSSVLGGVKVITITDFDAITGGNNENLEIDRFRKIFCSSETNFQIKNTYSFPVKAIINLQDTNGYIKDITKIFLPNEILNVSVPSSSSPYFTFFCEQLKIITT